MPREWPKKWQKYKKKRKKKKRKRKNGIWSGSMLLAPLKISKALSASGCKAGRQPKSSSSWPMPPCSPFLLLFPKIPSLPSAAFPSYQCDLCPFQPNSFFSTEQNEANTNGMSLPSLLPLAINALLTQCQCPRHGPFHGRGVVRDSGPPGRKNLHVTFDKASYHFFEISSEGKKSVKCCSRDIYGLMTQS